MLLSFASIITEAEAQTHTFTYNPYEYKSQETVFDKDLNRVENYLFRRTFYNNNILTRLARIERKLFDRIYDDKNITSRVNHILANYQDNYYPNNDYVSNNTYKMTPRRFLRNAIIGQPTGFSPQVMNSPFESFVPQFSNAYQSPTGYSYNNSIPARAGVGLHILD